MRDALIRVAATTAACVGIWGAGGCADDEIVSTDRGSSTIMYVPVQAIEATTYRGAAGYRHPVGESGLRQLDREYLRNTLPQGPAASVGYSIPVQAGAGVGGASPIERPVAPPPAAAAPVALPAGTGNIAPPVNPPLQSGGIQAPVSTPPAVVPVAPVAPVVPVAPATPGAVAPLPDIAPAPAPVPAPGPGNTLSIQPGAAPPPPAPQPAPAPNPNEVQQDPPERPQLPGADDAEN